MSFGCTDEVARRGRRGGSAADDVRQETVGVNTVGEEEVVVVVVEEREKR